MIANEDGYAVSERCERTSKNGDFMKSEVAAREVRKEFSVTLADWLSVAATACRMPDGQVGSEEGRGSNHKNGRQPGRRLPSRRGHGLRCTTPNAMLIGSGVGNEFNGVRSASFPGRQEGQQPRDIGRRPVGLCSSWVRECRQWIGMEDQTPATAHKGD
jgi:hypothetical protein